MSYRDDLKAAPEHFDMFAVLREFERTAGLAPAATGKAARGGARKATPKPRIGDSKVPSEDAVVLGQDPFLAFPASNLSGYEERPAGAPRINTRFLGFFGPQGALPLTSTIEALEWLMQDDPSFARFVDIFGNRFQQLFYRAWADARPIAQYERPADDRFFHYVGAAAGIGSESFRERDHVSDIAKVGVAGLVGPQVKSPTRLRRMLEEFLKTDVDIVERVGSWLVFEPGDRMALGANGSALGTDTFVGTRSYSINDKFRIRLTAADLAQYRRLLPSGDLSEQLTDLVFFYVGHRFEFDVELGLRADHAPPVRLGESGELGWTSWVAPAKSADDEVAYFHDARFSPLEMRRAGAKQDAGRSNAGRNKP